MFGELTSDILVLFNVLFHKDNRVMTISPINTQFIQFIFCISYIYHAKEMLRLVAGVKNLETPQKQEESPADETPQKQDESPADEKMQESQPSTELSERRKALFEPLEPVTNANGRRPSAETLLPPPDFDAACYPKGWLAGKRRKLVNVDVVESMRRIALQEMNRKVMSSKLPFVYFLLIYMFCFG